jgi:phage terminase large subunit
MTTEVTAHQRAFAVWFEDLSFWDARSQRLSQTNHCYWPTALLSDLCIIRFDAISEHELENGDIQLLDKISFADGKVFSGKRTETMMTQFRAKSGDIVVSKINARKKAVGIVSTGNDLGITIHFRSLVPDANKVDTCFLWSALRSQFCINRASCKSICKYLNAIYLMHNTLK